MFFERVAITRKNVLGMITAQSVFESLSFRPSTMTSAPEVVTVVVLSMAEVNTETQIQMILITNSRKSLRVIFLMKDQGCFIIILKCIS